MTTARQPSEPPEPSPRAAGAEVADSPFGTGPADAAMGALFGEYATGIGFAKLAVDGATFLGAGLACAAGWAR